MKNLLRKLKINKGGEAQVDDKNKVNDDKEQVKGNAQVNDKEQSKDTQKDNKNT